MQKYAKQLLTCKYMQKYANICRNMQTKITKICTNIKNMQIYAKICKNNNKHVNILKNLQNY